MTCCNEGPCNCTALGRTTRRNLRHDLFVAMKGRAIARPWGLEEFCASDLVVLERLRAVLERLRSRYRGIARRPGRVVKVRYSLK